MRTLLAAAVVIATLAARADAYPQFQLSRDQTCTSCHTSPAGGGLLTENGMSVAQAMSQYGTAPEFFYGKVPSPTWLELGGDFRGTGGYDKPGQNTFVAFPMQADIYGQATYGRGKDTEVSLEVTLGYRPAQWVFGNGTAGALDHFWSREHYLMLKQNLGGENNLYVRVGRFMPVFGLRFAEHPDYIRRYGGTQLYSETYGVAVEYIHPKWEAHATGFIADPLIDAVENYNGAALYGESRFVENASVGIEGMLKADTNDRYWRGGVTGKYFFKGPDILLQLEAQYVHHWIHDNGFTSEAVGYLMGSWFLGHGLLLDVGLGYYNENTRVQYLDRECLDGNLHWFTTSHVELILNTRVELFAFGKSFPVGVNEGGPSGGYVLLQVHYRL